MIKTEYIALSKLKKLDRNPRQIRDEQFRTLCKSIADNPDYFEARPIICSDRTGELVIIAGNQRYEAAKANKLKQAPVVILPGLTEAKEKEITIRDNVSNGEWDFEILANEFEIEELTDWGVSLPYLGHEANNMQLTEDALNEEFNPFGLAAGVQRVVFIFDGKDEAESYLKSLKVEYKKMNNAWQVNMSTLFT